MNKIIKRDGREVEFDKQKIYNAIVGANGDVADPQQQLNVKQIEHITNKVLEECAKYDRALGVEEIQDIVETFLITDGTPDVAKHYIRYRYDRAQKRHANTIDDTVLALVEYQNEDVKQENSNKDPEIIPTQRDYIAGEVSKDITRRLKLPPDITKAHDEGVIHFHDADYFIQHSHNCDLVNLDDMLQNGTVISGTLIEKPHLFSTACNIATQIIAQVASCQYGGQTITLAHLAPFVECSRQWFTKHYAYLKNNMNEAEFESFIHDLVKDDVRRGVQTIQYQVVTLMTTNGQAPFITVYMDINEVPDGQLRKDLALVIEETLAQRYTGVKNEKGVWITPAFPKLIYALDENNVHEGSEYWYLTKLAAKCTARRMVPDYISRKKMREFKNGDTYPCMG